MIKNKLILLANIIKAAKYLQWDCENVDVDEISMKQRQIDYEEQKEIATILSIFNYRCFLCRQRTSTVHELEPRARGQASFRRSNRVAVCRECHDMLHRRGASEENVVKYRRHAYDYLCLVNPKFADEWRI
jgi:5-methylcytosine-specific restriction endonuclease McrA